MTRQWGSAYEWVYEFLKLRDGELCYICRGKEDKFGKSKLIVEHKDNDETNHAPGNLGLAHRSCNTEKNPKGTLPPDALPNNKEREMRNGTSTFAHPGATERDKSEVMRARWLSWINDMASGPFSKYEIISIRSLCAWAPRGCARKEIGEVSLGVAQSYEDYVEIDSSDYGGPLKLFTPKEGDLKGVLCAEYIEQKPKIEGIQKTEERFMIE